MDEHGIGAAQAQARAQARVGTRPRPRAGGAHKDQREAQARQDLALVRRIANGDEDALRALYDRYSGTVYAICVRVLEDGVEAEQTLIDTFHELWNRSHRYDPARGGVSSYLFMLARSRAIDRRRARAGANGRLVTCELDGDGADAGSAPADPASTLVADEQRARMKDLLDTISPVQRQAIELAFYRGMTHQQIAQTLGIPVGTIKTRIRHGLARLRDEFRRNGAAGGSS